MENPKPILSLFLILCVACGSKKNVDTPAPAFKVYGDSVVQGTFKAVAISPREIVSNYQSPANQFQSPRVDFKFSINARDNEMVSGQDHHINCLTDDCSTPVIEFGKQFDDATAIPAETYLHANTNLSIKLDMRKVFEDFSKKGFFETFNGEKIYKEDFKGVYVAGNRPPLSWDFDNLMSRTDLQMQDPDGDHIYELSLVLNAHDANKTTSAHWKLNTDISAYPQYSSPFPITDAIYNLSLEEMVKAVEPDSTFRTGKEWAGVWTRDISYSIILSMAILQPKVAQHSLMRKVKNGVIIQDTGTGGAYPVSTDRMIWAAAAWEVYKVTGDRNWLKTSYEIIKKSIADDLNTIVDKRTSLFKGESSFLDWREQTYPAWMQPADIYESECLGTNVVHHRAHFVLSKMAEELGEEATIISSRESAESISKAINTHLWSEEKKYYGQFLYGRNHKILSPRAEALGEALAVLWGIADDRRAKEIVHNAPVHQYGIPCIYPQIPNIPPYHNNATWPFVQSYWTLACAKAGDEAAVRQSLDAVYRPTALFLTNKENFVSSTGDYVGTQINSDNMLWSLSGNIALLYKVLFGIEYKTNELEFHPFVPMAYTGKRTLSNFKYRGAILNIHIEGDGSKIKSFTLDGKKLKQPVIPGTLQGSHEISIVLGNNDIESHVHVTESKIALDAPVVKINEQVVTWSSVGGAKEFKVIRNGKIVAITTENKYLITEQGYGEFQVIAVDHDGAESFASEPVEYAASPIVVELETFAGKATYPYKGFSGSGFVEISTKQNRKLPFEVTIPERGTYSVSFRYANGNGPINTENKCAIRTLTGKPGTAVTYVFPHRGTGEWSDWGYSNAVTFALDKGVHMFVLSFQVDNMNVDVNQAMLDAVRFVKVK